MARTFVVKADEQTRVPFLRGILTRSLQKAGLGFEDSYRVASAIRDGLADTDEITVSELRRLVTASLKPYGQDVVDRYNEPLSRVATIFVESVEQESLPFSRGRHSQDLLAAGLTTDDATAISEQLYLRLLYERRSIITSDELRSLTYERILDELGDRAARRYHIWQEFRDSGRPLIVLIGGSVGSGKSTIATELAHRLDIVRTQSTDMLREVMRTMISPRLLPILHESTFTAWRGLAASEAPRGEPSTEVLETGYLTQSEMVSVVAVSLKKRAIKERVSIIVEGVHVHAGFARRVPADADAVVVQVMLAVLRRKRLKERIKGRGQRTPTRRSERYMANFDRIWEIQSYLLAEADRLGVPIVVNEDKETAVREVARIVMAELEADHALRAEPEP
jgi:2-phosphoglycerate kinase